MKVLRSLRAQEETVLSSLDSVPSYGVGCFHPPHPTPAFLRALGVLHSSPPLLRAAERPSGRTAPGRVQPRRLGCNSFRLCPSHSRFAWRVDILQEQGPLLSGKCLVGSCDHSETPDSPAGEALVTSFFSALLTVPSSLGKGTGADAGGVCLLQASLAILAL